MSINNNNSSINKDKETLGRTKTIDAKTLNITLLDHMTMMMMDLYRIERKSTTN